MKTRIILAFTFGVIVVVGTISLRANAGETLLHSHVFSALCKYSDYSCFDYGEKTHSTTSDYNASDTQQGDKVKLKIKTSAMKDSKIDVDIKGDLVRKTKDIRADWTFEVETYVWGPNIKIKTDIVILRPPPSKDGSITYGAGGKVEVFLVK